MFARRLAALVGVCLGLSVLGEPASGQILRRARNAGVRSAAPVISALMPPGVTTGCRTKIQVKGQNLAGVDRWLLSEPEIEVSNVEKADNNTVTISVNVPSDFAPGLVELRALGPSGLSNVSLLRVDSLPQSMEGTEPNHQMANATPMDWDTSVGGTLTPQDIDGYRVKALQGQRGLFEVEAERLGIAISPVLTLMDSNGLALARATASRGLGRDARLMFTFPRDGDYLVQIHDQIYAGSDAAVYRLRARQDGRYASALFPLGGPAGWTMRLEASGGTLEAPRFVFLRLPDEPGKILESPSFSGPGGSLKTPMRFVVGGSDRDELLEASGAGPTPIRPGQAVCGRIEKPGEVDRYQMTSTSSETVSVRIRAEELGSWLDSVVRVLDPEGNEIAQNDDVGGSDTFQPFNGQPPASADSRLSFPISGDGRPYIIEVYDRYGDGGPEYAYRLETGSPDPDFHVKLILDPNSNNRRNVFGGRGANPILPGSTGSLNLAPGSSTTLNFLVTGDGPLEPIEIEAEGLPFGVTADKATIRVASMQTSRRSLPPSGGAITLKVDPGASADLGTLRLVGRSRTKAGEPMIRMATAEVIIDTPIYQSIYQPPITRELKEMPLWVQGDTRDAERRPGFVGPPRPITIALKEVKNPGVLLQGNYVDLGLFLDPASPPPGTYMIDGMVDGTGVNLQTLVTEMGGSMPEETEASAVVRIVAAPDAAPGVRPIRLSVRPLRGDPIVSETTVEVQVPIRLVVPETGLEIGPERPATLEVSVERRAGADGPVELKLDLPKGVRVGDRRTLEIGRGEARASVPLRMEAGSIPWTDPKPIVVTGRIRMPRGSVKVEAEVRPMLSPVSAEK